MINRTHTELVIDYFVLELLKEKLGEFIIEDQLHRDYKSHYSILCDAQYELRIYTEELIAKYIISKEFKDLVDERSYTISNKILYFEEAKKSQYNGSLMAPRIKSF